MKRTAMNKCEWHWNKGKMQKEFRAHRENRFERFAIFYSYFRTIPCIISMIWPVDRSENRPESGANI